MYVLLLFSLLLVVLLQHDLQELQTRLTDIARSQSLDMPDVVFLIRIGKLYKSVNPSSALACVLICRYISPRAKALADKCKMKTILAP